MSELLEHIQQNIRGHRLFGRGADILLAVSGGVDSMVLMHILHELAAANHWRLTVAHLNHQLRGRSSEADERLVARQAMNLRLTPVIERADVGRFAGRRRLSLETAARRLRHEFLARTASRLGISHVALAHHMDDQIELFFLRLLRGSGGEGLAGMKWQNPSSSDPAIELVRPLLDLPKSALREYARQERIPFREDATNAHLDIQRNRIRHELLPLLRRKYQPTLEKVVARVMEILGREAEFVTQAAREWLEPEGQRGSRPTSAAMSLRAAFGRLPVAMQRRCVQLQLLARGVAPDFELVEQLRTTAKRPVSVSWEKVNERTSGLWPATGGPSHGGAAFTPLHAQKGRRRAQNSYASVNPALKGRKRRAPMLFAARDREGIVLLRQLQAPGFSTAIQQVDLGQGPGAVLFDGLRVCWRIGCEKGERRPPATPGVELFDADKVGSRIILRHWQAGDRLQPIGMTKPVKLQDLFTNKKVRRQRRHELILAMTVKGEVFWVEGLRIGERFKLTRRTSRRLQWRWKRL